MSYAFNLMKGNWKKGGSYGAGNEKPVGWRPEKRFKVGSYVPCGPNMHLCDGHFHFGVLGVGRYLNC